MGGSPSPKKVLKLSVDVFLYNVTHVSKWELLGKAPWSALCRRAGETTMEVPSGCEIYETIKAMTSAYHIPAASSLFMQHMLWKDSFRDI